MAVTRGMRRALQGLGLMAIFAALTFSFVTNGFSVAPYNDWAGWERGSEAMVLKRIEADLLERPAPALGLADFAGDDYSVFDRLSAEGLATLSETAPEGFTPYRSEIGGQAYLWSFLWRDLGCSSISCVHLAASALTAAAVLAVFLALSLIGSPGLGWAWLISAGCSPWITYAARNLFWSPWLYFLPLLAAVGLVVARSNRWRWIALAGVFAAFVIKYLGTGYHEFTAFTMLAAFAPLIAIVFKNRYGLDVRRQLLNCLAILVASGAALAGVLIWHAYLLAGNVATGLEQIWVNTVLRRTYGDAGSFDPAYAEGLAASPFEVVWRYVSTSWSTDLLSFSFDKDGSVFSVSLGRDSLIVLTLMSVLVVLLRALRNDTLWKRDLALLLMGATIPVVWFLAAKGYSYVHVHVLFFLWYFLYVPALLYVLAAYLWPRVGRLASGQRQKEQVTA